MTSREPSPDDGTNNEFSGTADNVIQVGEFHGDLHLYSQPHPATPAPAGHTARLNDAAQTLAEEVAQQWTEEAAIRGLLRPQPMQVRWSATGRPVAAHPAAVLDDDTLHGHRTRLRLHGDLSQIVSKFQLLPHRQLVVLGEPGAGKSVLAIWLTLELLKCLDPGDPVPVLLNLSSWRPGTGGEHLHTWMTRRLAEDYPFLTDTDHFGPDAPRQLVTTGRVLAILDGLDEIPTSLHAAAIDGLDHAVADGRPLVVTCRSEEYEAAATGSGRVLASAAVIELDPIDLDDAAVFLASPGPSSEARWRPVIAELRGRTDLPLAQALFSPLMVSLARTAYTDPATEPDELTDSDRFKDRAAIEQHLLDEFIPAVYRYPLSNQSPLDKRKSNRKRHDWTEKDVMPWLRFLATHLNNLGTYDLAWWQLIRAIPRTTRTVTFGLVAAIGVALLLGLGIGTIAGQTVGLVAGLTSGLCAGLGVGIVVSLDSHPNRVQSTIRSRAVYARRAIVSGTTGALACGLASGFFVDPLGVALIGLTSGIVVALAVVLAGGLEAPGDLVRLENPAESLVVDRRRNLRFMLAYAVAFGVAAGVAVGTTISLTAGLIFGSLVGVTAGPAIGLILAPTDSAWGLWLVVRVWLLLRRSLPWPVMEFLSDAHRRGVLRQAGAIYQFRHAHLQDHLSKQNTVR